MNFDNYYRRTLESSPLTVDEGLTLYENAPTSELMFVANQLRQIHRPGNEVSWMIDRNVNITNVCISGCTFCNFHRKIDCEDTYTTSFKDYFAKIEEMLALGGSQLLLQGGMHPGYGLSFYTDLFRALKEKYPNVKLHALGPPEVVHIARKERKSYREILEKLVDAGLDSLPGAGAEILSNRVRKKLSPGKATAEQWLDVMREAHLLNLLTSATMMFGHIETNMERIEHLVSIRDLQSQKPEKNIGFKAFIPWSFMSEETKLGKEQEFKPVLSIEYLRMIAISRIMLNNVENIQASWLTVGKETAQIALYAGANDLGSIMIEENVVSSAGGIYTMDALEMQKTIYTAGYEPRLRDQAYQWIDFPQMVPKFRPDAE